MFDVMSSGKNFCGKNILRWVWNYLADRAESWFNG